MCIELEIVESSKNEHLARSTRMEAHTEASRRHVGWNLKVVYRGPFVNNEDSFLGRRTGLGLLHLKNEETASLDGVLLKEKVSEEVDEGVAILNDYRTSSQCFICMK